MSYTKTKIYNLALSALLVSKEVVEIETDKSNEVRCLNIHWDTAFESTLKDLDLDSLSSTITLELIEELDDGTWTYVYKYPNRCALLRRIVSGVRTDTRNTHISKQVRIYEGGITPQRAIYTNEQDAVAEFIPKDFPLAALSPMAAMALAYKLAYLSAPLLVGKGAKTLRTDIEKAYIIAKTEAQEDDRLENRNYELDEVHSEFVAERIS